MSKSWAQMAEGNKKHSGQSAINNYSNTFNGNDQSYLSSEKPKESAIAKAPTLYSICVECRKSETMTHKHNIYWAFYAEHPTVCPGNEALLNQDSDAIIGDVTHHEQ